MFTLHKRLSQTATGVSRWHHRPSLSSTVSSLANPHHQPHPRSSLVQRRPQATPHHDCHRRFFQSSPFLHSVTRLGLGTHKFQGAASSNNSDSNNNAKNTSDTRAAADPVYTEILTTALMNGVTTVEVSSSSDDDGARFAAAYRAAVAEHPELLEKEDAAAVEILLRVGYRVESSSSSSNESSETDEDNSTGSSRYQGDVPQPSTTGRVYHNISPEWLQASIPSSPLVQLRSDFPHALRLAVLLHNPETQQAAWTNNNDNNDSSDDSASPAIKLQSLLTKSFQCLEQMDCVDSYGVTSNGLCLPSDHPLHVRPDTILDAAASTTIPDAHKFRHVQFPLNALEPTGLAVAKILRSSTKTLQQQLHVSTYRPLACYPRDHGTGHEFPLLLADYQLPATMEAQAELSWSHTMVSPPQLYASALNAALQHFDAEELIARKANGEKLSTEERETLDGAKLMQSVLHDLDAKIDESTSVEQHQHTLTEEVIPVIYDTFDSYDADTAHVLQVFFGAYNLAVRWYAAQHTRRIVSDAVVQTSRADTDNGVDEDDNSNARVLLLQQTQRLQEFALRYVLQQQYHEVEGSVSVPLIDKIIVGCSATSELLDTVTIAETYSEDVTAGNEQSASSKQ